MNIVYGLWVAKVQEVAVLKRMVGETFLKKPYCYNVMAPTVCTFSRIVRRRFKLVYVSNLCLVFQWSCASFDRPTLVQMNEKSSINEHWKYMSIFKAQIIKNGFKSLNINGLRIFSFILSRHFWRFILKTLLVNGRFFAVLALCASSVRRPAISPHSFWWCRTSKHVVPLGYTGGRKKMV